MAFHLKRTNVLDPNKTVYYTGGVHFSDDYSKRKTYVNKGNADSRVANPDGKNGGFATSIVVEE